MKNFAKKFVFVLLIFTLITLLFSGSPAAASEFNGLFSDKERDYLESAGGFPYILEQSAKAEEEVYLGGIPIGISIRAKGLIVVGLTDVLTADGAKMPERSGEIYIGDQIVAANDIKIQTLSDLKNSLSEGKPQRLTLLRGSDLRDVTVCPLLEKFSGTYKLGIMVKEEVNGIGTLTFVTKDKKFGSLGHRIADRESGLFFDLNRGDIFEATITGCVKGARGRAGELQGGFSKLSQAVGNITKNTPFGVFGEFSGKYFGKAIKTAHKDGVKMGKAQIYTTVSGCAPKFYDIEIVKSGRQNAKAEKGIIFNITDKELLNATGGIVQGMSGSPIVQNGKLIGAVTHVFVNDPTRGYGIYVGFMLDEIRN
jgi:stage IV sporulation protein B